MKTVIELMIAAITISFLVFFGSAFYFGTFDLIDLSDDKRVDIMCAWGFLFFAWIFFF